MHQSRTRKPLKPAGGKNRGTCTPDQGSGATLGVLGILIEKHYLQ